MVIRCLSSVRAAKDLTEMGLLEPTGLCEPCARHSHCCTSQLGEAQSNSEKQPQGLLASNHHQVPKPKAHARRVFSSAMSWPSCAFTFFAEWPLTNPIAVLPLQVFLDLPTHDSNETHSSAGSDSIPML